MPRSTAWRTQWPASPGPSAPYMSPNGTPPRPRAETDRPVPPEAKLEPHTHLVFRLDNSHELRFRDARRFGSVTYFPNQASWEAFLATRLGPEPWDLTPAAFRSALKTTKRAIKAVLLDQTVV